jgi:hypothetical protein
VVLTRHEVTLVLERVEGGAWADGSLVVWHGNALDGMRTLASEGRESGARRNSGTGRQRGPKTG